MPFNFFFSLVFLLLNLLLLQAFHSGEPLYRLHFCANILEDAGAQLWKRLISCISFRSLVVLLLIDEADVVFDAFTFRNYLGKVHHMLPIH